MSKEAFSDNFAENLGITDNDIETRDSLNFEARLLSAENGSTSLPSMSFAASAVYSREGNDLVMTLNGDTVVVANYFATPTPPTLTTLDGAILSPSLIASFLPHDVGQNFYASSLLNKLLGNGQSLDSDAIAVLEGLEGSVLVIRDGKATTLQQGDQIFQGDQISTASDSSANLIFADGTQFKIGGEARIALDSFSFESSTSQGLQLLSILSGAFSYVSGLVAKNDPANVQLRTPFGEIGIRGTKIVGEVDTEKAEASVTLLEGRAIYTSPQGEEYEINQGFDTLKIKDGGEKIRETTISADRVAKEYDVFENVGEVSNFLHQAPATQQDQDQGGAGAEADLPLPDISYSQAQAEVRALAVADATIALEGSQLAEGVFDQIVDALIQSQSYRQEQRLEALEAGRTVKESIYEIGDGTAEFTGTDNNVNAGSLFNSDILIDLSKYAGKVIIQGQAEFGNTFGNDIYSLINGEVSSITLTRGYYDTESDQFLDVIPNANNQVFYSFSRENTVADGAGQQPSPGSDSGIEATNIEGYDLSVEITLNNNQKIRILFEEYFPNNDNNDISKNENIYSILHNGELTAFSEYPIIGTSF